MRKSAFSLLRRRKYEQLKDLDRGSVFACTSMWSPEYALLEFAAGPPESVLCRAWRSSLSARNQAGPTGLRSSLGPGRKGEMNPIDGRSF